MYILTELGIKDKDDRLIICIDEKLNTVRENVGIDDSEIVRIKDGLAYFTIKNAFFGNLEGECRLFFKQNLLRQIIFIPSMKGYIRELKQVTRQGLYSCVYKAYREIIEYINSLNLSCLENEEKKSIYYSNKIRIVVAIDNTNESVCVIQEANNE